MKIYFYGVAIAILAVLFFYRAAFAASPILECSDCKEGESKELMNENFKIGDLVVFSKKGSDTLCVGTILGVNQSTAIVEYINPNEPTKIKEIEIEFSRLTRIEKVTKSIDLGLNMPVIFKRVNSEWLWPGAVVGINQTTAVIEYTNPSEPSKIKEVELDFTRLFRVFSRDEVSVNNDTVTLAIPCIIPEFKVGDYVKFEKVGSSLAFEGTITAINLPMALVEYYDAKVPSIKKEIELDISKLTRIEKPVATESTVEKISIVKAKDIAMGNPGFIVGDHVKFFIPKTRFVYSGEIVELGDTIATVEYSEQTPPFKKSQIDVQYDKLKKEKSSKEKPIREKPQVDYPRHIISVGAAQIIPSTVSISYEYKVKELIGLRFPVYFNWNAMSVFGGLNPRFYFNRNKVVQGFAGPKLFFGMDRNILRGNVYGSIFISVLADAGISVNPVKNFNITANCGIGLQEHYNWDVFWYNFTYCPELSIGFRF